MYVCTIQHNWGFITLEAFFGRSSPLISGMQLDAFQQMEMPTAYTKPPPSEEYISMTSFYFLSEIHLKGLESPAEE